MSEQNFNAKDRFAASACLCGQPVRYDGQASLVPAVQLAHSMAICPETLGGLPTPRAPAEIVDGDGHDVLAGRAKVMTADGVDVTDAFVRGAQQALERLQAAHIDTVCLKANSPSCGFGKIYDGQFQGQLKVGDGVTTALLQQHGIRIISV